MSKYDNGDTKYIWNGGCSNSKSIKHNIGMNGHTVESCNAECKNKS